MTTIMSAIELLKIRTIGIVQIHHEIKFNIILLLILINSFVIITYDIILSYYFKSYKGNRPIMKFFKEWANNSSYHAIAWDLIYLNSVLILFLYLMKLKLNLYYPIMILSIILQIFKGPAVSSPHFYKEVENKNPTSMGLSVCSLWVF